MATNKDGLEPGQPVSFEEMQRVNRRRQEAKPDADARRTPRGKARERKTGSTDEPKIQGVSGAQEPETP